MESITCTYCWIDCLIPDTNGVPAGIAVSLRRAAEQLEHHLRMALAAQHFAAADHENELPVALAEQAFGRHQDAVLPHQLAGAFAVLAADVAALAAKGKHG